MPVNRLDKAQLDLQAWRRYRGRVWPDEPDSYELTSVVRAVDAAFKGEVLECRIREALHSQSHSEAAQSNAPVYETPTGKHRWDFDWWLTEATLRALHAGIDATAQLLNLLVGLGVGADDPGIARKVAKKLAARPNLANLSEAVCGLTASPEVQGLCAFVNHVKHAGFPKREARGLPEGPGRVTSVGVFVYQGKRYGDWSPDAIDSIIDGCRGRLLHVLEAAAEAPRSG